MGSGESVPCPHCGKELPYTSTEKKDGGVTFHWPADSYAHLQAHSGKAKK